MSLIPVDLSHLTINLQNDAQQMRTNISWTKERYQAYNQNCTVQNMTAAGIATADQNAILAFIGDLNRLITLYGGALPVNATDMAYDVQAILGIS